MVRRLHRPTARPSQRRALSYRQAVEVATLRARSCSRSRSWLASTVSLARASERTQRIAGRRTVSETANWVDAVDREIRSSSGRTSVAKSGRSVGANSGWSVRVQQSSAQRCRRLNTSASHRDDSRSSQSPCSSATEPKTGSSPFGGGTMSRLAQRMFKVYGLHTQCPKPPRTLLTAMGSRRRGRA